MWNRHRNSLITPVAKVPAEAEVHQEFSDQFLSQVKDLMGVTTVQDQNGTIMTIPVNEDSKTEDFAEFFIGSTPTPTFNSTIENDRMTMYDMYDQMEIYVPECSITLNTYRDEILGTGFVDKPFTVWSSDKSCQEYINKIFKANKIEERFASYVKALLKYGDTGFLFHMPLGATRYDKDDLQIEFIRPKDFRVYAEGSIEYAYDVGCVYKPISKLVEDMYNPQVNDKQLIQKDLKKALTKTPEPQSCTAWDFCHWSIYDADYAPYGRSVLDSMRTLSDQKATMEVLMALGRASKVERIVLEITAPSNNPTVAMSQVMKTANTWKNMIMGADGAGGKNRNNTMGMTDVLTIPKDVVKVNKLNSSFDVAGTQDVEYFRDQLITLSRIQKSNFMADQSINRGSTLEAQDLRFARAMTPYAKGVDDGINQLAIHVALLGGFDLTKIAIKVTTNRPAYVTKEYLLTYEQLANSAASLLSKAGVVPQNPEYNSKYIKMLRELGMPESYLALMRTEYKPTTDQLTISPTPNEDTFGTSSVDNRDRRKRNNSTGDTSSTYSSTTSSATDDFFEMKADKMLGTRSFIIREFNQWKSEKYDTILKEINDRDRKKDILNESEHRSSKVNHKRKK